MMTSESSLNSDFVISGISGRFPNADNVFDLWNALLNGELLARDDAGRWPPSLFGINAKMGIIRNIEKVDADFFGLKADINYVDPQDRIAYEVIYEAIWDAGIDPFSLRGTRTALLAGHSTDDTRSSFYAPNYIGVPEQSIGTIASNFGFVGPSFKIDTACSSSAAALHEGLILMRKRICDYLIVLGTNSILSPFPVVVYMNLGTISREGVCRCLDAGGNGYGRSEAVAAIFVQKITGAKRVYASILSSDSNNDGYKEEGGLYPKTAAQTAVMKGAIKNSKINPLDIDYVEAHITGTSAGDPVECKSILTAFRGNEQKPLLVGCLKSNIGHTEPCAMICAIIKAVLIFENEIIPRNINYKTPNPNIKGLMTGRLLPVLKNTPFTGDIIAVNSMGFGGANISLILRRNEKNNNDTAVKISEKIPRLVNICGRTEEGVIGTMRWIQNNKQKVTIEFLSLLNDVSKIQPESGMVFRGFMLVDAEMNILHKYVSTTSVQQPLYFLLPGVSEHLLFNADHMDIKPFAESVAKSTDVAMKLGIDLKPIFNDSVKVETPKELIIAFATIQIAFYETLKFLEITPAACIGYATGELLCSFIHGSLTREMLFEQLLLIDYNTNTTDFANFENCVADISGNPCIIEIGGNHTIRPPQQKYFTISLKDGNNIVDTLISLGQIYTCGHNPKIEKLCPKVDDPVPRKTASLSPLLKWNHKKNFYVSQYPQHFNHSIQIEESINLNSDEYRFLCDHAVDGRILFPATGYIYFALRHFLLIHGIGGPFYGGVLFEDLKFKKAITAEKGGTIKFKIRMNSRSGQFLIVSQEVECVSGRVQFSKQTVDLSSFDENFVALNQGAIYKEFRVRGYDYGSNFQALVEADFEGRKGRVKSPSHLINYLDTIIHLMILNLPTRDLYLPTRIGSLFLDLNIISNNIANGKIVNVIYESDSKTVISDGYLARNISFTYSPRRPDTDRYVHYYSFVPLDNHFSYSSDIVRLLSRFTEICVSIVKSMKSKKYTLSEMTKNEITHLEGNYFQFVNDLVQCFEKKWTLHQFVEFATNADYSDIAFNIKKADIIEEQLQVFICSRISAKIAVVEVNNTRNTSEATIKSNTRRYNCSCDYKVDNETEFLSNFIDLYDLLIYEDRSSQLLLNQDCIPSKDMLRQIVQKAYNNLRDGGIFLFNFRSKLTEFEKEILCISDEDEAFLSQIFEEVLNESQFTCHSKKTDDSYYTSIQLRKIGERSNSEKAISVISVKMDSFEWINEVKTALEDPQKEIWLKSNIREVNGVVGLTRSLRHEYESQRIKCIVGDECDITDKVCSKNLSVNVIKNGVHGTMMLKPLKNTVSLTKHAYIDLPVKGDLSSFQWIESNHKLNDNLQEAEDARIAKICCSSLNFKDLMIATNRISANVFSSNFSSIFLGFEFAGVDTNGRRIFGTSLEPCIATTVLLRNDDFIFEVPEKWTLTEASTVATAYLTVYYGLIMRADLKTNESVLIHSGSGAVGQAAIRVCLSMNCDVYTSVGNEERKRKLQEMFPRLKEENIVDSRSVSFEEKILKATNGRGVDVVLNSLSEEKLTASINCLADGGRFVEIGKYDIGEDSPFERIHKNVTFHVVCLHSLQLSSASEDNKRAKKEVKELRDLIKKGIEEDTIQPLPTTVFEKTEIEDAFRFMAAAKHFGKVVIKIKDEKEIVDDVDVIAHPKAYFYPTKVYVIIGGLGGMGLQLAYWMVQRGARNLVLTSRRGITEVYQKYIIELMERDGCQVVIEKNSGDDYESVMHLLQRCTNIGPIGGIFNSALVLETKLFEDTTPEMFESICAPKVKLTDFLDQISRNLCPHMDYFVCFSSVISWVGNEGQAAYGFANSAMETICKRRRKDGFHALAIQWGAIGDVGYFHEVSAMKSNEMTVLGMKQQRIYSCLEVLDIFLANDQTVCGCVVLSSCENLALKSNNAVNRVLHILGISEAKKVDERKTLVEFGADSLMIVEIRHLMEKYFNVSLTNKQIRALTLDDIGKYSR